MKKRLLFIINPISGTHTKEKLVELIANSFPETDFICRIEFSQYHGHAVLLARKAVNLGYNAVVACGGDGTINEVGGELTNSNTALGIIPMGSGNGLARHLKIPLKNQSAIDIIKNWKITPIDTGKINDHSFIGIAGIGFDAYIGKKFANYGKRGFFTYLKLVLKEYKNYKERTVVIKRKGHKETIKAMMITVANSSQFGNNAVIAPTAKLNDGTLKLCIVRKFPLYKAPQIAWLMLTRQIHRSAYLDIIEIKKATIKQTKKIAHLDGEPLKLGRKIKIKVLPNSLQVIVP